MEAHWQSLHINDAVFENMREDADRVLQRLIKNMVEKDSLDGKITITVDVTLTQEYIPNMDPNFKGDTRRVLIPKLAHKVGSVMQIKNEAKGDVSCNGMELAWDDYGGEYVVKPIANTSQMSIFDTDFWYKQDDQEERHTGEVDSVPALECKTAELPGSVEEDDDMSDEFDDSYGYEDPGDDF